MSNQARCMISILLHLLDVTSCWVGLVYFGEMGPFLAFFLSAAFCVTSHLMRLTDPSCAPRSSTVIGAIVVLCGLWFMFTALWHQDASSALWAWGATGTLMYSGRLLCSLIRHSQMKPIAIHGVGPKSQIIGLAIKRQVYGTYKVRAFLQKNHTATILSVPCLNSESELPSDCRIIDPRSMTELLDMIRNHGCWMEDRWSLRAPEGPGEGVSARLKRVFDIAIALAVLVPVAMIVTPIALLMIVSGQGPPLYAQKRLTRGGRRFSILKLRTMPLDAEPNKTPVWPQQYDTRATPMGRILRQLWLDELPQLWNVLKGDLSWVGPRPERPEFSQVFSQSIPKYALRHRAKAGVTGLAQIRGFVGNTSLRKRLICDLEYIRTWSFWLDLQVLLGTVCQVFMRRRQPVFDFTPGEGKRIP